MPEGRIMISPMEDYEHDPFGGTGFKKSVAELEKGKPVSTVAPAKEEKTVTFDLGTITAKKKEQHPIKLTRLLTGEELVGETEKIDADHLGFGVYLVPGYLITKPLIFMTQPQPGGKIKAGLVPWMPYTKVSEERVFFKAEHVILSVDPAPEIVSAWKSMTSGLALATKPSLIVP